MGLGKVYFVGAGPGDPGLLTLRGAELLRAADVVLYDGLANLDLLRHAQSLDRCYSVGKHGQSRIWTQAEINERLVAEAASGKSVVRLKGGDPIVFGRLAEECDALREAGIGFEIVPGITAALAAGAYAGIPVTHRGYASAVALVTGHEEDGKEQSALDWSALAKFPGSLVIYMGVTTVKHWSTSLMQAGMSPTTPAAIVRRCSWPDQEMHRCTLGDVAEQLTPASKMRPPVIVVLGPVVQLHAALDWFSQRPLFGKTILVTRPAQSDPTQIEGLKQAGAQVLLQPAIEIVPLEDFTELDATIHALNQFDWVVFSSVNGVEAIMRRIHTLGKDARCFASSRIACVGPTTAAALSVYGLRADCVAESYQAEGIIKALAGQVQHAKVLLIRASRGRDILQEQFEALGAKVTQVVGYVSRDTRHAEREVKRAMETGEVDWVTVTSSAIARSLVQMFGQELLKHCRLASISAITSETLRSLGLEPTVEAQEQNMQGVVAAIMAAETSTKEPS